MSIKLLALDIDGTLLNSQFQVSAANRRAIEEAMLQGVMITLVTGRRFAFALPIAQELNLGTPLVCHNGALTKNTRTLDVLDYQPLAVPLARRIVEIGRAAGAEIACNYDPEGYGRLVLDTVSAPSTKLRRHLERASIDFEQVPDLRAYIVQDPIQVMSAGTCAQMDRLFELLQDQLGYEVKLLKTAYPHRDLTILDVLSPQCSKGTALAAVVTAYGFSPQDVMAIGDNHNDLEMLEFAGLGVVMKNAENGLKNSGYFVTPSNDEDGVAAAIQRFILGR